MMSWHRSSASLKHPVHSVAMMMILLRGGIAGLECLHDPASRAGSCVGVLSVACDRDGLGVVGAGEAVALDVLRDTSLQW